MEVRFVLGEPFKKIAVRHDMTAIPRVGEEIVLADDKDYRVTSVAWDLFNPEKSAAVVTLEQLTLTR